MTQTLYDVRPRAQRISSVGLQVLEPWLTFPYFGVPHSREPRLLVYTPPTATVAPMTTCTELSCYVNGIKVFYGGATAISALFVRVKNSSGKYEVRAIRTKADIKALQNETGSVRLIERPAGSPEPGTREFGGSEGRDWDPKNAWDKEQRTINRLHADKIDPVTTPSLVFESTGGHYFQQEIAASATLGVAEQWLHAAGATHLKVVDGSIMIWSKGHKHGFNEALCPVFTDGNGRVIGVAPIPAARVQETSVVAGVHGMEKAADFAGHIVGDAAGSIIGKVAGADNAINAMSLTAGHAEEADFIGEFSPERNTTVIHFVPKEFEIDNGPIEDRKTKLWRAHTAAATIIDETPIPGLKGKEQTAERQKRKKVLAEFVDDIGRTIDGGGPLDERQCGMQFRSALPLLISNLTAKAA